MSETKSHIRICTLRAVLVFSVLSMCTHIAFANAWTIDQLMSSLAQTKSAKAKFSEIKYISALDAPIESSGELVYVAPDKLEKRTLKPRPELMQLDGDTLLLERGTRKLTMNLSESPEAAALIESIRGTLAGDRKALEKNFKIGLTGTRDKWKLMLTPTQTKAMQAVQQIEVGGTKGELQEIEVLQSNGDRSITVIEKKP